MPAPTLAFLVPRTFFWRFFFSFRCLRDCFLFSPIPCWGRKSAVSLLLKCDEVDHSLHLDAKNCMTTELPETTQHCKSAWICTYDHTDITYLWVYQLIEYKTNGKNKRQWLLNWMIKRQSSTDLHTRRKRGHYCTTQGPVRAYWLTKIVRNYCCASYIQLPVLHTTSHVSYPFKHINSEVLKAQLGIKRRLQSEGADALNWQSQPQALSACMYQDGCD